MSFAAPSGTLPRHIAIIMDGNGWWARSRGLPRIAGHRRGAEAVRRTLTAASELGIPYLTLFGFSSENWKRPLDEVDDLMGLLRHYLRGEIADLHRNSVRLRVIGEIARLSPDIVTLIDNAEALTRDNGGINLTIALSYGGRAEIAAAVRAIAAEVKAGPGRLALRVLSALGLAPIAVAAAWFGSPWLPIVTAAAAAGMAWEWARLCRGGRLGIAGYELVATVVLAVVAAVIAGTAAAIAV